MSNYSTLKTAISAVIKQNNNHEITGQVLQTTLLAMVDSLAGGYLFKGVATPSTVVGTPDENVFYIGGAGTYSNFGATPVQVPLGGFGIFTYNGSFTNYVLPSGGALDISLLNASGGTLAQYASLSAALAAIPESLQRGGMEIKYVQTSDNKYVQYRLMSDSWSIDTTDWSFCGDDVLVENPEFIVVGLAKNKRILFGVQKDGNFYFGCGIPSQIKNYVLAHKEEIIAYVDATKVEKEEGKSLIQEEVAESIEFVENAEFINAELDHNKKVLGGRKSNGNKFENMPFENPAATKKAISDPEGRFSIELDRTKKILSFRDERGILHENAGIKTPIVYADELILKNDSHKVITLFDKTATIENGNIYNYGSFENAPSIEYPVYGTILIEGVDAKVEFYNERPNSIVIAEYVVQDGVKTEILIPSYFDRLKVGTASGEPVSHNTDFRLVLSYQENNYKITRDIINLRNRNKYLPIMQNLMLTKIGAGNKPSLLYKTVTIACLTDIHDNIVASREFFDFYQTYKKYLSDIIGLGDYHNGGLDDPLEINSISGWHQMLKVIGNHDAYHEWNSSTGWYDYIVSEAVDYAAFMDGDIQNWGVTYQENKTYYYKDYDDAKLRVIFLDYMHWDEENDADGQKAWLQNILYGDNADSASAKGYHVVVCVHSRPKSALSGDIVPFDNCSFMSYDGDNLTTFSDFEGSVPDIIDEFMTNHDGNFICYLCGHYHVDVVGVYENYPKQISIVQACSAAFEYSRDSAYPWDTDYTSQFSVYSFDTDKKFIRVYRVGANYNRNMQHKESMLIQYGSTVKLLSIF